MGARLFQKDLYLYRNGKDDRIESLLNGSGIPVDDHDANHIQYLPANSDFKSLDELISISQNFLKSSLFMEY